MSATIFIMLIIVAIIVIMVFSPGSLRVRNAKWTRSLWRFVHKNAMRGYRSAFRTFGCVGSPLAIMVCYFVFIFHVIAFAFALAIGAFEILIRGLLSVASRFFREAIKETINKPG